MHIFVAYFVDDEYGYRISGRGFTTFEGAETYLLDQVGAEKSINLDGTTSYWANPGDKYVIERMDVSE